MQQTERIADESLLVSRAQRGDVDAFETLYRLASPRIYGLCLRMTSDRQRASELLQDVFVRIWEVLPSFRGDSAFGSWAYRLTVNLILEESRREWRRDIHTEEAALAHDHGYRRSPDSVDSRIDIERAMIALTPAQRHVFVMHDVLGYRHTEIADMLGLAASTLRAQLHTARKVLMEELDK